MIVKSGDGWCLLARPEPAEYLIDTDDDDGDWKLCRVPDLDDPRGWINSNGTNWS